MSIHRVLARLRRAAKTLRGTSVYLRGPRRGTVVIVDRHRSDDLIPYLADDAVIVLDVNGESIYLWPLLMSLVRGGTSMFDYTVECIRRIRPRLVLTAIDTTVSFYRIKSEVPWVTTIAVQNGKRGYDFVADLERNSTRSLRVDHVLCFGELDRNIYGPTISGEITTIGSVRNNRVDINPKRSSRSLALISTLRSKVELDSRVPGYGASNNITYREIFDRRLRLAQYVHEYCSNSSLELRIIGKDLNSRAEADLYATVLGPESGGWTFIERTDDLSSYSAIDESQIVVTTSSTLGYESLARGIPTAFLMLDVEVTSNFGDRFAWPLNLPDDGPFWTNRLDKDRTFEILDLLGQLDHQSWCDLRSRFVPLVIDSDPGNSRLTAIITSALRGQP